MLFLSIDWALVNFLSKVVQDSEAHVERVRSELVALCLVIIRLRKDVGRLLCNGVEKVDLDKHHVIGFVHWLVS
jgi:hypothetical protein